MTDHLRHKMHANSMAAWLRLQAAGEIDQRELQVLMMIARGDKNQAIAETLNLSPKTVSTYRTRLHEKLEVGSDVEMVHLAMQHGILDDAINK